MVKLLHILFLVSSTHLAYSSLPHGLKACRMSSSDFNDCIRKEIIKAVQILKNGDKRLGLLPLDPLVIEKLQMSQGTGPVSFNMTLNNLKLQGISDTQVLDLKNNQWKEMISSNFVKKLVNTGKYKIAGKVLSFPMNGEGDFSMIWEDLNVLIHHALEPKEIRGKKYLQTKSLHFELKPKKAHFQFDNLFNGNKQLGDATNAFINENWEQIVEEVHPAIERAVSQVLSHLSDQVLRKIPMEEIILN